jgi:beta-glucosidase
MSNNKQLAEQLLAKMTLEEKIGQMAQVNGADGQCPDYLCDAIRAGRIGSIINEVNPHAVAQLQNIAKHESRLGIPLLIGRDVIHGFKTIFPIPLGQAATWDPSVVRDGARIAAEEASEIGVNWTFAPMIDIARDPRWGRIAESMGEDPYLCAEMGKAMVQGFQTDDLSKPTAIAATAKHFMGYGASESGRDYNTANIPENELRNVHGRSFHAVANENVATFMASFSDLNGVPPSGNRWLLDTVLRKEWGYKGFVVSDWASIQELCAHGLAADEKHAALLAANAGVDMEMATDCYRDHLPNLIEEGQVDVEQIDTMVLRILTLKYELGLFGEQHKYITESPVWVTDDYRQKAKNAALKSCVLLKNQDQTLPLHKDTLNKLAVIGPLADDGYEQLGTWIFDGDDQYSVTCLNAIRSELADDVQVDYVRAMHTSRSHQLENIEHIDKVVSESDACVLVLGEEAILSGEAHCRSNIDLPGAQHELIKRVAAQNKPVVLVVMAGRPLTLEPIIEHVDAILFAWHPGTMGGPAIVDLLFGHANPSGKTPVSFPHNVGQVPVYYAHKNTGRPPSEHSYMHQDDFPIRAPQISPGMSSTYLDVHYLPLFPFGFGLSYTRFDYSDLQLSSHTLTADEPLKVSVTVGNTGDFDGEEVVQLYIRDKVGSVTRPVKELKGFQRVAIEKHQHRVIEFELTVDDLAFYDIEQTLNYEAGEFDVWVGPNSADGLHSGFYLAK